MIDIYYNMAQDYRPGWCSGLQRFESWAAFSEWLKRQLEDGREVLVTGFTEV